MIQVARCCLLAVVMVGPFNAQTGASKATKQPVKQSADFLFEVQPKVIAPGETATLRWSVKGASKVVLEEASGADPDLHKIGTFNGSGTLQVRPLRDTTYVISCDVSAYTCASVSVRVRKP
jgi:hypothetical protein